MCLTTRNPKTQNYLPPSTTYLLSWAIIFFSINTIYLSEILCGLSQTMCVWSLAHSKPCFLPFTSVGAGRPLALFERQQIETKLGCIASCILLESHTWRPKETWGLGVLFQWHVPHWHGLRMTTFSFSFLHTLLMLEHGVCKGNMQVKGVLSSEIWLLCKTLSTAARCGAIFS